MTFTMCLISVCKLFLIFFPFFLWQEEVYVRLDRDHKMVPHSFNKPSEKGTTILLYICWAAFISNDRWSITMPLSWSVLTDINLNDGLVIVLTIYELQNDREPQITWPRKQTVNSSLCRSSHKQNKLVRNWRWYLWNFQAIRKPSFSMLPFLFDLNI